MNIQKKLVFKKTWLVTGVAGFIGSNTAEFLLKYKQNVIGLDNLITGSKKNLIKLKKYKNFKFIKHDLNKRILINKKIDFCIHMAALNSVPRSFDNPNQVLKNNISSLLNIILFCKYKKIKKLIYASSSSVYGEVVKGKKKETQKLKPISPYAISKVTNELIADIYADKNFKCVGLRFFNIYGYNQKNDIKYSAVLPSWIRSLKKNNKINVFGNSLREFCYIDDAIKSILLSVFINLKNNHEVLNISGGKGVKLKDFAKKFKSIFGNSNTKIILKKTRHRDIKIAKADLIKTKKYIGFKPSISIINGLIATQKKLKNND